MAKQIFNENFGIEVPTLILERRDFSKIGIITAASNIEYKETLNSPELSFQVYKSEKVSIYWDNINNYNLIYIPEYNEHFAMKITTSEENFSQKTIECTFLPKDELQNIKLRNIEINTEDDIARDDYDENYPTVFYRDLSNYSEGSAMYEKLYNASLLHRILDKVSNYTIGHVDSSLVNLKTWFQYSITDNNVYDVLTGQIAEDYQCLFKFDSTARKINVYDLCNTCQDCKYRGDFHDVCPECGSTKIGGAYGKDTSIYISKENLATSASIESNKDNLKNCLFVAGGDDFMTSAVALANPSGSNYIFGFSDEMFDNMPDYLTKKIKEYNNNYTECLNKRSFVISSDLVTKYNEVVSYINKYYPVYDSDGNTADRYTPISETIVGYKNIAALCYDCIDMEVNLQSAMGKTLEMDHKTISETMGILTSSNLSPVAVKSNISQVAASVVTNTVIGACKSLINTALYKIEAVDEVYSNGVWSGKFKLTSIEDNSVTLTGNIVSITVNNDIERYLKQNIQRQLNKLDTNYKDLKKLDLSDSDFQSELKYYSFDYLSNLKATYSDCLSIILESENETLKTRYQSWYNNHILYIENEMNFRQNQIDIVNEMYDYNNQTGMIYELQKSLKNELDIKSYLGDMWDVFCAYRMEDTYQNDNYISDGLSNSQIISRANELIDMAKKELYKASHVQYTVTSTINNLLALPEFRSITEQFEVGSWIHVCVDDVIYFLRLLSYKIYFDDISKMEVEFSTVERTWSGASDVSSVIEAAQSMASSFSYATQKIKNHANMSKYVENWVQKGMDATATKIVNNAENQNIVYDSSGILCRTYDDLTDKFDLCQSRLINSGLYVTDDGWESTKAAIGKYIYIDSSTGKETQAMGVLADAVVGKIILGEKLGIYNASNSLTFDLNGLTITNGTNTFSVNPNDTDKLLCIKNGNTDIFYVDDEGSLHITGNINATSGEISGFLIENNCLSSENLRISKEAIYIKQGYGLYLGNKPFDQDAGFGDYCFGYLGMEETGEPSLSFYYDGKHATFNLNSIALFDDGGNRRGEISAKYIYAEEFAGNFSGNASSATKLQNVSTIKIGDTSKEFDGSQNLTWTKSEIGFGYKLQSPKDEENKCYTFSLTSAGNFRPNEILYFDSDGIEYDSLVADGVINLGIGSYRLKQIYAVNSTISTSDRNYKKDISQLSDKYLEFFLLLQPVSFLFKDGDSGRTHVGFISQDVESAMEKCGLTDLDFAGFCKDEKVRIIMDEDGNETEEPVLDENGDITYIYSLRYEEFIALNTFAIQKLWHEMEELKNEFKSN